MESFGVDFLFTSAYIYFLVGFLQKTLDLTGTGAPAPDRDRHIEVIVLKK